MNKAILSLLFLCGFFTSLRSQPAFTANDTIVEYQKPFGYGVNPGAFPPWTDENLANIAAGSENLNVSGLGVTTLRPWLPDWFIEEWGIDIRLHTFKYYQSLGLEENVIFVGDPSPEHLDSTLYCSRGFSTMFKNMFDPIWDQGQNGTLVNDNNFFAAYMYRLVKTYGPYVRFWEILNEPDTDLGGKAILKRGEPGNWFENNPEPCDTKLKAPIQHYVRMLRIAYEVIKVVDPEDYVAVGGLGNSSFLHAVLRNSDNPVDGSVSSLYPLKGGAYFDVLSFHAYPHYDGSLRFWSNDLGGFDYLRNSDEAVDGYLNRKNDLSAVLEEFGYNDRIMPRKHIICTETNITRQSFISEYLGTEWSQRNYVIKTLIQSQKEGIKQVHWYSLIDEVKESDFVQDFNAMGLYKNVAGTNPHYAEINDAGIAYRTTAELLKGYEYDSNITAELGLKEGIEGGAFVNENGEHIYVLWSRCLNDKSELSFVNFSLAESFHTLRLERFKWNYSKTKNSDFIDPWLINLSGNPIFLKPKANLESTKPKDHSFLKLVPNPTDSSAQLFFYLNDEEILNLNLYDEKGGHVKEIIRNRPFEKGSHVIAIERQNLSTGLYFLKVQGKDFSFVEKLVFVNH